MPAAAHLPGCRGRLPAGPCPWARLLLVAATLAAGAACAAKVTPVTPAAPQHSEYVFPLVPADLQRTQAVAARTHQEGWSLLQAGDLRTAERRFTAALKRSPAFFPSEAALGYVELSRRDPGRAVDRFDRALAASAAYVPALVGRGQALLALNRDREALDSFERALAADPGLSDVRRRVEVLRFKGMQDALAAARKAAHEGRLDEARLAYTRAIEGSPDSAFLHRELAGVEQKAGNLDAAATHARRAVSLDPADGAALLLLADVLEAGQDWDGALETLRKARAVDPSLDVGERIQALEDRAALARLPEEYRAIAGNPRLTRGELAALIGVRLEPVLRMARRRGTVVVTDARGHWAQPWIVSVTRAGIMEVYSNHTFQPRAPVRRIDFAQVVDRLLTVVRASALAPVATTGVRPTFSDIGTGHLGYKAASEAVAAGVMKTGDGNAFQPSRVMTGQEAIEALAQLERLVARAAVPRGR